MKCGIEIHQRLATKKLFCCCNSEIEEEKPLGEVVRRQRAVAGELGDVDPAALHEFTRGRVFAYQFFRDSTCLVELDEEPPHAMNKEALEIVLQICLLLNADVVDEVHVMRKTVIDGSNTTGFQRTAVVGLNGFIETSQGKVGIPTICLEEESAGIVGEEGAKITYRLDRLAIPLVEIATSAEIKSPDHAREVAEKIGIMLRATGRVQRGIGTIRQDLNISIEGGARVEIKGAQELKLIPALIENEVKRQESLLTVREELRKRGAVPTEPAIKDVTRIFGNTKSKLLGKCVEKGGKIFALSLPKFSGILGKELCSGRRFGTELSDYAKAKSGVKGLIHSDERFEKYGISGDEIENVKKELSIGDGDAFVIVADDEIRATRALEAAHQRAMLAIERIPEETRRALPDGTSEYMRPLPGSARLYPETDVPPVRITAEMIERIRKSLPEKPEETMKKLREMLSKDLADKMIRSKKLNLFKELVAMGVEPKLAASTLEDTLITLRREGINVEGIGEDTIKEMFAEYLNGLFVKAAIPEILKYLAQNKGMQVKDAVERLGLKKLSSDSLRELIEAEFGGVDKRKLVEHIMKKYRLRVDANELNSIIKSA